MTIRQANMAADLYCIEYNERMDQVTSCHGDVRGVDVEN